LLARLAQSPPSARLTCARGIVSTSLKPQLNLKTRRCTGRWCARHRWEAIVELASAKNKGIALDNRGDASARCLSQWACGNASPIKYSSSSLILKKTLDVAQHNNLIRRINGLRAEGFLASLL
jgi:hypothetical protein